MFPFRFQEEDAHIFVRKQHRREGRPTKQPVPLANTQSIIQCHRNHPDYNHGSQSAFDSLIHQSSYYPHRRLAEQMELIRRLRRHVDWWLGERACSLSSLCCVRTIILVAKILSAWQSAARLVSAPPELRLAGRPGSWPAWRRSPGQWPPATNSSPLDRPSPYPP